MKTTILTFILLTTIVVQPVVAQEGWQWVRGLGNYDFTPSAECACSLELDKWGNVYVAGEIGPDLELDSLGSYSINNVRYALKSSSLGGSDIWLAKYSPEGKQIWFRSAGSKQDDRFYEMIVDSLGNTFIAGYIPPNYDSAWTFNNKGLKSYERGAFIAKLDSAGSLIWNKSFYGDTLSPSLLKNIFNAYPLKLFKDDDELNVIIEGGSYSNSNFNSLLFGGDTLANGIHGLKLDLNGNLINYETFPFPNANNLPPRTIVNKDERNNYFFAQIMTGRSIITSTDTLRVQNTNQNYINSSVIAIDSALHPSWNYISNINTFELIRGATYHSGELFVLLEFGLNTPDTITYGNFNNGLPLNKFGGNGFLSFDYSNGQILGYVSETYSSHSTDVFLESIFVNEDFIALSGHLDGEVSYGAGADTIKNEVHFDGFFVVFDRNGKFLHQEILLSDSAGYGLSANNISIQDSILYLTGQFRDKIVLHGRDSVTVKSGKDIYLAKYDLRHVLKTSLKENPLFNFYKADNGILAYPNPTQRQVTLMGKALNNQAQLFSISGQLVRTYRLDENAFQQQISLDNLDSGIYFLIIVGESEKQTVRIVKQ